MGKRKAVSPLLASTLYVAIAVFVIALVLTMATPFFQKLRDKAAFENAKQMMSNLNSALKEVVAEGRGSTRLVSVNVRRGVLIVDNESNTIEFRMKTEAPIVARSTMIREGDLIIAEGDDVDVIDNGNVITMRNSYLEVNISKVGTKTNWQEINLSQIIQGVYLVKENTFFDGTVRMRINDVYENGTGYVYAEMYGRGLPRGRAVAHLVVNGTELELVITLPSYADFLIVETKEVE